MAPRIAQNVYVQHNEKLYRVVFHVGGDGIADPNRPLAVVRRRRQRDYGAPLLLTGRVAAPILALARKGLAAHVG